MKRAAEDEGRRRETQGPPLKRRHEEFSNHRRREQFVPQPGRSTATGSSSQPPSAGRDRSNRDLVRLRDNRDRNWILRNRGREHKRDVRYPDVRDDGDRNRDLRNRFRVEKSFRDKKRDAWYRENKRGLRDDEQKLREYRYRESESDEEFESGDRESGSRRSGKRGLHTTDGIIDKDRERTIDKHRERARRSEAACFWTIFTEGGNSIGRTECIWAHKIVSRSDSISCGIMWVGVLGMDSLCVVTRKDNLEQELIRRVGGQIGSKFLLSIFKNAMICEVEDLAELSSDENSNQSSIEKPFAVVSVVPCNNEIDKVSGPEAPEYGVDKAIKFLQDEMNSNTAFTFDKTIQTAISALQHLSSPGMIKANEIRAFVCEKDDAIVKELPQIREGLDVEEHLAVINALDS